MNNKTSDKNVANIEDIKVIQHIISFYKDLDVIHSNDKCKEIAALEHILAEQKQDKARIQELEAKLEFKQWGDLDNIQFEEYMNQFVSKQKVKDKIEEYDRKMTEDKGHPNWVVTDRIVMNVLEELLEDK